MTNGEIDILIGTQMAAKGHHFPNLTLVAVVDADLGLNGGDLRAAERTFQLLYQVAGRAGRQDRPGTALVQTYIPENSVMQAVVSGNRDRFVAAELADRAAAGMPPYGRLAALIISGADPAQLDDFCAALARRKNPAWRFLARRRRRSRCCAAVTAGASSSRRHATPRSSRSSMPGSGVCASPAPFGCKSISTPIRSFSRGRSAILPVGKPCVSNAPLFRGAFT
jgi:hypothetical protein